MPELSLIAHIVILTNHMFSIRKNIDSQIEHRVGTDHLKLKQACAKAVFVWTVLMGLFAFNTFFKGVSIFNTPLHTAAVVLLIGTGYIIYRMHVMLIMTSPVMHEEKDIDS